MCRRVEVSTSQAITKTAGHWQLVKQAGGDRVLAHYAQGPGVPSLVQNEGRQEKEKGEKGWTLPRRLRGCQHFDLRLLDTETVRQHFCLKAPNLKTCQENGQSY